MKVPFTANTACVNTISVHDQPFYPGDLDLERRIRSVIRWNAMAMVVRANRQEDGKTSAHTYDKLLVAVGRCPVTGGLGLEHTAVQTTPDGCVHVDSQRRTDEPSILAIGDVAGQPMLAHKATHEGCAAAEAIVEAAEEVMGHRTHFFKRL